MILLDGETIARGEDALMKNCWLGWRDWRYTLEKLRQRTWMWVAWKLPHKLVYWAMIRAGAAVTTREPWTNTVVPEMTFMDALERWGGE